MTFTKLHLNYAVASDRGLVRSNNEDSAYAGPYLIALADGMGGHAAGEVASQLMINQIKALDGDPGDNDMLALLGSVADDGNRAIASTVRHDPATDGMGTTLTALMFNGAHFALLHVGDSRGYRLRDGKLEQITVDDTFVQSLVEHGELDPADISTHPQRSLILKAYTGRPVDPTLKNLDAKPNDRLLLCSDGLSDPVTHSTIEEALRGAGTPQAAADRLVELALRSGGPDNVTVVVADVVEGPVDGQPLPTVPLVAGALNSDTPENPRPDTSAGRAALLRAAEIRAQDSADAPIKTSTKRNTAETQPESSGISRRGRRTVWTAIAVIVLMVAAGLGAGAFYTYAHNRLENTYFVHLDDGHIVIHEGSTEGIGPFAHNILYQATCLDWAGRVSLIDADQETPISDIVTPSGCRLFRDTDLPQSRRPAIATLPPGDYDAVVSQVQRLADDALPPCVTRSRVTHTSTPTTTTASPTATSTTEPVTVETTAVTTRAAETESPATSSPRSSTPVSTTSPATPGRTSGGDLRSPGFNCREVDPR